MNEDALHNVVAQYLALALPDDAIAHHSMNEGKRGWHTQRKLKRFGVVKGWPDVEIVFRGRAYFIELKAPGTLQGNRMVGRGYCSKEQRDCQQRLRGAGAQVITAWSLEEVQDALIGWGIVKKRAAA